MEQHDTAPGVRKRQKSSGKAENSEAPESKAVKLVTKCEDCGATPSSARFPTGVVDACAGHWSCYLSSFTMHGTWLQFLKAMKSSSEIQRGWEEAGKSTYKAQQERTIGAASDVCIEDGLELAISTSMVGLARAAICDLLGGKEPEREGIKLQDLVDHNGKPYKCLLAVNPMQPWPVFTLKKKITIKTT